MKRILPIAIILITLTACTTLPVQTPEPAATEPPPANMPNPASVYCEQNGYELEIHTSADGSQSGTCVFPDGSTCDEWAYSRGECAPAAVEATATASGGGAGGGNPGNSMPTSAPEAVTGWRGVIKSIGPGAQFDDYFERQDLGQVMPYGIDSMDPAVRSQIEALRDSGRTVCLYGTLVYDVPDVNGSQILVERIEVEE